MPKKRLATLFLSIALICCLSGAALADVALHSLFTDHMVVQQKMKIPVWGTAAPGEEVTVTLGKRKASATACDNGEWIVKLKPLKPGAPLELVVQGTNNTVTVKDVLVGEVWVCSGQSNMQFNVANSNNAEQEVAEAKYPGIRLFSVPRKVADTPQKTVEAAWQVCSPETIPNFSAVAYFFGRDIHKELGVPVGLIHTSWGGTPSEAWTSREKLESIPVAEPLYARWKKTVADYPKTLEAYNKKMAAWKAAAEKAKAEGKQAPAKPRPLYPPLESPHYPSNLYNAMIAPLLPYAIQGAIWYQGESNAGRAYQYRYLFPGMIEDWREAWGQGDFPFLFVQLANFRERQPDPVDDPWAELREAQLMTLDLKNTGMAVIIDIGDAADIHPRNKQDVGKRLALAALAGTYGKRIPYSGPIYRSSYIRGDKVYIRFDHTNGGLTVKDGDTLKGFAIAGADRKFVWADAVIKGKKIVVSADSVPEPVAVRYAWQINPEASLFNGAGLPASPFRTDEWPGITLNSR